MSSPDSGLDGYDVYGLQIRRSVPTECDIGKPSFKVATCLTPSAARKLGLELLNVAEHSTSRRQPSKGSDRAPEHPVGDAAE